MLRPNVQNDTFQLSTGDLILTVTNDDAQLGLSTAILLPGKILAVAPVISIKVGTNGECKGQQLYIEADVRDVLQESDKINLKISLRDDSAYREYIYPDVVKIPDGGTEKEIGILYKVTINLT